MAWKRVPAPAGAEAEPPAPRLSADEKAARLLALRPHFRRELEQKLARGGFSAAEVAAALARLERLRLLDDAVLAANFVETVARRKGWGRARIAQELVRRGAAEETVSGALAGRSVDDDLAAAREAADRFQRRGGTSAEALARHLARRGFARSAIFKVLKEMAPSAGSQEEAPAAED